VKIPDFLKKQMSGTSMWLGKLKFLGTHISVYVTSLTLAFTATSAYTVAIQPFLESIGIALPFIVYLLIIVVALILLLIFEYKIVLPGFFSLSNKQWYEHDNPMVADIKELKTKLEGIEALLKEIKSETQNTGID
jgi:hypothetical protein